MPNRPRNHDRRMEEAARKRHKRLVEQWRDIPDAGALLELYQRFFTQSWYVFAKIMRGELWEALDGLHDIRSPALVPLLDWAAGWPQAGHRRLEGKVDPETLYAALRAEMDLYCL
jgi:hypothetical protein